MHVEMPIHVRNNTHPKNMSSGGITTEKTVCEYS